MIDDKSVNPFDYVEVFDAIPIPATLIDVRGNIVDINQAFLEYARRRGRDISKEDRIGHPIGNFTSSEEERVHFERYIHDLLHQDATRHLRWETIDSSGHSYYVDIYAQVLKNTANQVTGAIVLREDVTKQVRQEQRKRIISRARGEIWKMRSSAAMEQVLIVLRDGLRELGVPFNGCGVNLVDQTSDLPSVQFHSMTQEGRWFEADSSHGTDIVLRIWKDQAIDYRRDLKTEDRYAEFRHIENTFAHPIRAVVDVPFSHGTLAVNSTEPDAFSREDIEILQEMAQVLSEGFSRLEDFRTLEQRNRELKNQIAERQHQEAQRLAQHRVREEVWKMSGAEDIREVLEAVGESLEILDIPFQDWGINVVDVSTDPPAVRYHNMTREEEWRIGEIEHRGRNQVFKIWQTGVPLYRRDLETEDLYQEREYIGEGFRHVARSVIDVPFSHGTLAINSTEPEAFSEQDIVNMQEIAAVLSEGFQRMEDLQQLAAERERLLVTLRSIGDGVIATDAEGKTVLVNQVAEQLTGWTQEEAVGSPFAEVFRIVDEQTRQPCEDPVSKVVDSGLVVGLADHTTLIARDGTERNIADSGAPIRDRDGRIIGAVLVFRDVTAQRKMEAELLKAEKLESLGVLAGGIAHDFNNILTVFTGTLSLAKTNIDPLDELFGTLSQLEEASVRATQLTQQLLTFSKGGTPVKKTASIAEIIEDSTTFSLRGSNVRCEFAMPEDLWPVEVDTGQISQVIQNLVINADQALPEGGILRIGVKNITLDASQDLLLKAGRYVEISVADQGAGIPRAHLQRIFEPYFSTKQKGSGLGLATVYSIVKNHDGQIAVESTMGTGTTFKVYLPALFTRVQPAKKADAAFPTGQGKILVMDDDKPILILAGKMLKRLGYEVDFASDGAEALDAYQQARDAGSPFAAVVLDLTIPGGMGGKETIQQLRMIDPEVKAIVSSGYSNDPIIAEFRQHGFIGVVAKPYNTKELGQVLQQVLAGVSQEHDTAH